MFKLLKLPEDDEYQRPYTYTYFSPQITVLTPRHAGMQGLCR